MGATATSPLSVPCTKPSPPCCAGNTRPSPSPRPQRLFGGSSPPPPGLSERRRTRSRAAGVAPPRGCSPPRQAPNHPSLAHAIERDTIDAARINHEPSAYRLYLEGQLRLKQCDLPELRRARSAFRRAADIDRNFALPRAYIAQTLQLEWLILGGTDPGL